jgi:hemerythrin superfamily protein
MDAISMLKQDHRKVEGLFKEIKEKKEAKDRERLFKEIKTELTVHTDLEEKLFYPAVLNAKATHDEVIESLEEHKQVKMVLSDLEQTDKSSENWMGGLTVLMEDVQHHIHDEENELFPKVKKEILSEKELEDLGKRMEELKTRELASVKER